MKLLIITQKVDKDDPILGFFHRWILEFAKHFELITVICLEEGTHELPSNVRVLSLGKVKSQKLALDLDRGSKVKNKVAYAMRFYKYIWLERKNYDAVFAHMNPIYVALGGFVWKMLNKKVALWYTHKNVDLKLRIAEKFADKIFTASKESFRLESPKVKIVGHGIDTDAFSPAPDSTRNKGVILSVGRVSSTKNQLAIIQGFETLIAHGYSGKLLIVGDAVTQEDLRYKKELQDYVLFRSLGDRVMITDGVPPDKITDVYRLADLFVNLSSTGSLDKAVLEAMACGLNVLTSNEAFRSILSKENLTDGTPKDVAYKLAALANDPVDPKLRECVVRNHSLTPLIARLASELKGLIR